MTKSKKKKEKKVDKKCNRCGGKGQILHLGGIEHGTYERCPYCFGTGQK